MDIQDKTIFITGGTGGIGGALVTELERLGARKIYATYLRSEDKLQDTDRICYLPLDVTNEEQIMMTAERCADVDIVINNAGVEMATSFTQERSTRAAELEMKVNFHGSHYMAYHFLPYLKQKQEAMLINVLSIGSFVLVNKLGTYCASKAAVHFLTKGLRLDCANTGVTVMGVYPGYVDTEMTKKLDVSKVTPESISKAICLGIKQGKEVVFPDPMAEELKKNVPWDNAIFENLMG